MLDLNKADKQTEPKDNYKPSQPPQGPIQAFADKMAEHGLNPGEIIANGEINRFGKNDNGWYVIHIDDISWGSFGDWAKDMSGGWCSKSSKTMTWEEREQNRKNQEADRALREAAKKKLEIKASKVAQKEWDAATTVIGKGHPYLAKKGVDSYFLRIEKNGALLVPGWDETGKLWSLQYIYKNGKKKYQPAGKRKGVFFEIPGSPGKDQIYICEGYSTGASIHAATGGRVIGAFDAGNLPRVAKVVRAGFPDSKIILAADDDSEQPGNPGITKATMAAKLIGGIAVWPRFSTIDPNKKTPTDFNDLATLEGLTVVSHQLTNMGIGGELKQVTPPLPAISTTLSSWLVTRPKNREYILHMFGEPFMPKDVVGALAATGGTGKTFFLMALAAALASGGKLGPISAPKSLNVLCIFGEDDQDELGRRFWDICKGDFPKKLHAASVYGQVGPLMRMDGKNPVKTDGFRWLDETITRHPGLEVLIFDPKSRFYGLEENNNDHATQWIGCLEELRVRHGITILFATHTSEANAGKVSQAMNRGASAIVDGCRWQAGMATMDKDTADRYCITDRHNYVVFGAPKSNYTPRQGNPIYFKRGQAGVLEYAELKGDKMAEYAETLRKLLIEDGGEYTQRDLKHGTKGQSICQALKLNCMSFERRTHTKNLWYYMINTNLAKEVNVDTKTGTKLVLKAIKK